MTDSSYQVGERRPIAARGLPIYRRLAERLAASGISPNGISVAGMICCILAGVVLAITPSLGSVPQRFAWLAAALLVQLRLQANLLDGMVALAGGRASPVGELYNEVPDRVSDIATFVGLGYAAGAIPELGYLAACLAVLTAYVRVQAKVAGAPMDFAGPMAKQHRMALLTAVLIYMTVTPVSWQPTFAWASRVWGLAALVLVLISLGCLYTCARRLLRAAKHLQTRGKTP